MGNCFATKHASVRQLPLVIHYCWGEELMTLKLCEGFITPWRIAYTLVWLFCTVCDFSMDFHSPIFHFIHLMLFFVILSHFLHKALLFTFEVFKWLCLLLILCYKQWMLWCSIFFSHVLWCNGEWVFFAHLNTFSVHIISLLRVTLIDICSSEVLTKDLRSQGMTQLIKFCLEHKQLLGV